jgi:type IV secretion system protein VirB10
VVNDKELKFPRPSGEASELRERSTKPEGTLPRQAQTYVIAGITIVILLAVLFSNRATRAASKPPQARASVGFRTNERLIGEFGQALTEQQRAQEKNRLAALIDAQSRALAAEQSAPSPEGGPAAASGADRNRGAVRAGEGPHDAVAAEERELAYRSRFASNLVLSPALAAPPAGFSPPPAVASAAGRAARLDALSGSAAGRGGANDSSAGHPANVSANRAEGPAYVIFEGTTLDCALVNRLEGDFAGPVKAMVSSPVFSHDRQRVLIPEGTLVLGEAAKVESIGQRRLAVVFHRMIMPDGYSIDLDQFRGLDQIGETGFEDEVNHHYAQIFGASIALGVLAGAVESSNGDAGIYQTGSQAYRAGVASSLSQSSTQILDRFLNIPPSITIREGHRVKVYFTQDLLLPAYENHAIAPDL